ncbi:MAG: hypothetical protein LAT67_00175 [Balneolales bacterium]|nr:hypothetical protein [Balneolales bacterium]
MRVVGTIPNDQLLITIFLWNNKYLVKFEAGPYEQSYKIDETWVSKPEDIQKIIDDTFIESVKERFLQMNSDFSRVLEQLS